MKIAIVPGSFDPMTLGHMDLVKRATGMFDKVIVGILINPEKKYMFTMEEKKKIAELSIEGMSNVEVVTYDGYLVDLARKTGASVFVKGARTGKDFVYEYNMAIINSKMYPEAETIILPAEPELKSISSTKVREKLKKDEKIDNLVSKKAAPYIYEIYKNKADSNEET